MAAVTPPDDHGQAAAESAARTRLLSAGGADLPRAPWLRGGQPPSAVDLVHLALWRARSGSADDEDLLAALALLPAARAELDQLEAALLFAARSHGLPWRQVSQGMGLASPQAAQQRFDRVTGRVDARGDS
ncbi:hypothetical protein SAMN05660350_01506 [Geodermatophilus obscurus]|uniref:DNA-binding protein n=1 Tax=Geodermatophilus obscurus TaxID=1861 RepID=A0A1M7T9E9_9ACTN|nr:hypothetical protein SAMN05660350_01506 [Geodermatophilus obscurus]